ncbi:hypothetical protein Zmor_010705 [Zophobas morio]|uniref:Potassium channel domain-containing protein n=1 Tax=Zophobas morio TaxID=2755281 RepID=A0AA38ILC3_9CUCU|nr:hypothetical protein Zmor_010705 [Zophobas morio]
MMSKKQWFVVLCIFIVYLLLGAAIFHIIESDEERERNLIDLRLRDDLSDKIDKLFDKFDKNVVNERKFRDQLQDYCGKSFRKNGEPPREVWDYYHSVFFVITVVSTIGYGNLAPTTMFTRIFMIFYGLIGIPMNGIVMVTLGTFFGRSFTKLYQRWKTSKMQYDTTRLGLISQIVLYLVPGFTFFIFLPSSFMVLFENWELDVAVYYCFVTLTTIGFGDYVAGVENVNDFQPVYYWMYKVFLLVWVIGGLGYVVMILGFITQALQSKKMQAIEQIIKQNIKKTPVRIREELRGLLQEFLFMKVKRVYKGEFDYIPSRLERSQSCPDLNIYRNNNSPTTARKRALSECPHHFMFQPIQSDTNLDYQTDRDSYQASDEYMQQSDLLMKVVDALSILDDQNDLGDNRGYDGISETDILASERYGSKWSLKSQNLSPPKPKVPRRRAVSDIRVPSMHKVEAHQDVSWYAPNPPDNYQSFLERQRTFSVPSSETEKPPPNFITRIKNKFISTKDDKHLDVEQNTRRSSIFTPAEDRYLRQTNRGRASVLSVQQQEAVLEQTSIADLIRAFAALTVPETMLPNSGSPKRKLGTAGLTPPKTSPPRMRRVGIRPNLQTRRTSLMPDSHVVQNERRRLSLRPVEENLLAPPPYSAREADEVNRPTRRFSRILNVPSISISPVQRQVNKRENKDES